MKLTFIRITTDPKNIDPLSLLQYRQKCTFSIFALYRRCINIYKFQREFLQRTILSARSLFGNMVKRNRFTANCGRRKPLPLFYGHKTASTSIFATLQIQTHYVDSLRINCNVWYA